MTMQKSLSRLVAATVLAASPLAAVAQDLTEITVLQPITVPDIRYAPWAVAMEQGWLEDEGLKVNMPVAKGSIVAIQQLQAGNAEFAQLPPDGVTIANSKGANLEFFYSIVTRNPFPVAVQKGGDIKSLADLKDKNIGLLSLSAVQFYTTQPIMRSVGYEMNTDYTYVDVGAGMSALKALQDGNVAALAQDVLIYAGMENRGAEFDLLTTPEMDRMFAWGLVGDADYIAEHPDVATGLARALTKGRIFCTYNKEECVRAYFRMHPSAMTTGIDEETAVAEQIRVLDVFNAYSPKPETGNWGDYDPAAWEIVMDYLQNGGLIDAPVDIDRMYTSDLVAAINDFDEAEVRERAESVE